MKSARIVEKQALSAHREKKRRQQLLQPLFVLTMIATFSANGKEHGEVAFAKHEQQVERLSKNLLPAQDCPDIFGDEARQSKNKSHREEVLEDVVDGEYCIDITYNSDWLENPQKLSFGDLCLLDTWIETGFPPFALIEFSPQTHSIDCPPGRYVLTADDAVGEEAQVLAILDGLLLLEYQGKLRYLKTEDSSDPECWRLIWYPDWTIKKPLKPVRKQPKRRTSTRRGRRR